MSRSVCSILLAAMLMLFFRFSEGWIVVAVNSTCDNILSQPIMSYDTNSPVNRQTNMVLAVTQPLELTQGPTC